MIFNPVVPMPKKIETIQARDIAVGSSVYLNEGGNYVEYLVVNQGIPSNSSLYDSSCNGTWLLRKDIHSNRVWNTSNVNIYETSAINTWLNSDFFNSLGTVEQTEIKQVKIPYRKNGGSGGTDQSGTNGLSCKIFLLSGYEVGWTTSDNQHFPQDGAKLDYFESGTDTSANNKRIAYLSIIKALWFLRSPYTGNTSHVWAVEPGGGNGAFYAPDEESIRPALILPFNAEFDKTNMRLVGATTYPANFADATWAQIIDACKNNAVPDTWAVGNQKTMTINNSTFVIDIIGKNHDTYSTSGTAPLTFQLHDCYGITDMNDRDSNSGGWGNCKLRKTNLPYILSVMPNEVQTAIKQVVKHTSKGGGSSTIEATWDKLFLLSEIEVFGNFQYSCAGEGTQYDYYKAGNSKIKNIGGSANTWWERSPKEDDAYRFCVVDVDGSNSFKNADRSQGISFAFCF